MNDPILIAQRLGIKFDGEVALPMLGRDRKMWNFTALSGPGAGGSFVVDSKRSPLTVEGDTTAYDALQRRFALGV